MSTVFDTVIDFCPLQAQFEKTNKQKTTALILRIISLHTLNLFKSLPFPSLGSVKCFIPSTWLRNVGATWKGHLYGSSSQKFVFSTHLVHGKTLWPSSLSSPTTSFHLDGPLLSPFIQLHSRSFLHDCIEMTLMSPAIFFQTNRTTWTLFLLKTVSIDIFLFAYFSIFIFFPPWFFLFSNLMPTVCCFNTWLLNYDFTRIQNRGVFLVFISQYRAMWMLFHKLNLICVKLRWHAKLISLSHLCSLSQMNWIYSILQTTGCAYISHPLDGKLAWKTRYPLKRAQRWFSRWTIKLLFNECRKCKHH